MTQFKRPSVIIFGVQSLDDARYFSARMVDHLIFNLANTSIHEVIEIKEWVEGPGFFVYIPSSAMSLLDEVMIKIQPEGLVFHSSEEHEIPTHISELVSFYLDPKNPSEPINYNGISYRVMSVYDSAWNEGENVLIRVEGELSAEDYDRLDELFDRMDM